MHLDRPAFAVCVVTGVDEPTLDELRRCDADHAAEVVATYGERERYLRLRFALVEFRLEDVRRQNLGAVREWLKELDGGDVSGGVTADTGQDQ
ncbi:hypothetical protein [Humisphaera borealis]|uniref:Uncharacterized protein n=1 Tax=Humisphaera borealis TaxID=2807512 RepID=A0A7M2WQX5_9BACT|nr:hypothetical protein [Humisphaera borealis]QOV87644.1 hypothetical protein IPV69_15260 [Humisphaera borealis]